MLTESQKRQMVVDLAEHSRASIQELGARLLELMEENYKLRKQLEEYQK